MHSSCMLLIRARAAMLGSSRAGIDLLVTHTPIISESNRQKRVGRDTVHEGLRLLFDKVQRRHDLEDTV